MRYTVLPITSDGDISEEYTVHSELDTTKPSPNITKILSEVTDACRESKVYLIMEFNKFNKSLKIVKGTIIDPFSGVKYPYSYLETLIQLLIDQDNL